MTDTTKATKPLSLDLYTSKGEARVVKRLVRSLLSNGHSLSVSDGDTWVVIRETSADVILAALGTTGEDVLRVYQPGETKAVGSIYLLYGNAEDGSEVIADHTTNETMDVLLAPFTE